ncbi:MAG: TOBE domain-containing protein, partial [Pseudomonadota bacterium]|nr:TOBE domain-containing protein [Pseudomonadota bacterium]
GGVDLAPGLVLASTHATGGIGTKVRATLRQEDLELGAAGAPGLPGRISMRIFEGASVQYVVTLDGGPDVMVRVPSRGEQAGLAKGTAVVLSIPADRVFVSPDEARP